MNKTNHSESPPPRQATALSKVAPGATVRLVSVDGGRELQHRLTEMGLTPGQSFTVLRSGWPGPAVIRLRGARLVLGRGMVDRVMVRPADTDGDGADGEGIQ